MEYSIGIIVYGNLLLVVCMSFLVAVSFLAAEILSGLRIFSRRKVEEPQDSISTVVERKVTFPLTNVAFCSTLEKGRLNHKKTSPKYNQPRSRYGTQRVGFQNRREPLPQPT